MALLVTGYIGRVLKNSDYFKVKSVILNKPREAFDFSYLVGRNIFSIDLKKESRYISEQYPVYKSIKLFRFLPDRMFVAITERKARAAIRLYRYFCVDDDGVLFDLPKGSSEEEDLPVITGLERKLPNPKSGKQYSVKELTTALNIIREIEFDPFLEKYKIARIDAADLSSISCFIRLSGLPSNHDFPVTKAVEIKMPQQGLAGAVRVIAGLFRQQDEEMNNIKYIDLRFKEPVIKYNNAS